MKGKNNLMLIILGIILMTSMGVKSQNFEVMENDTSMIEMIPFQAEILYVPVLTNHVNGNYTLYYLHFQPNKLCMTYSVMKNKLVGFVRRYSYEGKLEKVYYYDYHGTLLYIWVYKKGKIIEHISY
jgi:hypothetical protein